MEPGMTQELAIGVPEEIKQLSFPKKEIVKVRRVEVTDRDLKIFEFILDMKFARIEDVFEKFFKKTISSELSKSEAWAKKRLSQLEQAKFLRSTFSHLDSERYFWTTLKAYHALANVYPGRVITKPSAGLDHRTLTHDRLVLGSRLQFERECGDVDWISDRRLKLGIESSFGLSAAYVPDGG